VSAYAQTFRRTSLTAAIKLIDRAGFWRDVHLAMSDGAGQIFFSFYSGVTASTGFPLATSGSATNFELPPDTEVWVIATQAADVVAAMAVQIREDEG
jgi:hypothetical protein